MKYSYRATLTEKNQHPAFAEERKIDGEFEFQTDNENDRFHYEANLFILRELERKHPNAYVYVEISKCLNQQSVGTMYNY